MNKLEEMSNNNQENYKKYLRIMTDSIKNTTKGMIPILANKGKNILDVGCGSGVLLSAIERENKQIKLTGVDLNIEAINKLKVKSNWTLIHCDFMELSNRKFDTIIFSSILHEMSSYYEDPNKRFTDIPIKDAFRKCNELLEENGIIILRDGLLTDDKNKNNKLILSFINPNDSAWLYRFKEDFRGFDKLRVDTEITKCGRNKYEVSEAFLKEFLCTYTWGEESYTREINERYGILTKQQWIDLLEITGFKVETIIESKEQYENHLREKVVIIDEDGNPYNYPFMTITIKARKK